MERHMRTHHKDLTNRRKSIIYIRLYKGDVPVDDNLIYVDDDLVIRSHRGLDMRCLYHVRLSMAVSERLLDTTATDNLRRDPEATYEILKTLDNELSDNRFLDNLVSDTIIKRGYVEQVLHEAELRSQTNDMSSIGNYVAKSPESTQGDSGSINQGFWSKSASMKTVQSLLIVIKRKDKK